MADSLPTTANLTGHPLCDEAVAGPALAAARIADLALRTEGLDEREREHYWRCLLDTITSFASPDDALSCTDPPHDAVDECQFCERRDELPTLLLVNDTQEYATIACTRCLHLWPDAARLLGRPSRIVYLSQTAARAVHARYPTATCLVVTAPPMDDLDEAIFLDPGLAPCPSFDDLAPEGLGADEFDWDAYDPE